MIYTIYGENIHLSYDSMWDLQKEELERNKNQFDGRVRYHTARHCEKWYGFHSIEALHNALVYGWPEAVERTKDIHIEGVPPVKRTRRVKKRADFGEEIDIQSVYSGDLDTAWSSFERKEDNTIGFSCATVIVNMATFSGVRADTAFWKGATAVLLSDYLQAVGKSVEIVAMEYVRGICSSRSSVVGKIATAIVKEFEYPLDKELVFAALSPGVHRRYFLQSTAKAADLLGCTVSEGYGRPSKPSDDLMEEVFPRTMKIVVPMDIQSREECISFVKKTVEELKKGDK